jgi:hypothetical protein
MQCRLDPKKICDECGECNRCDLDPNKLCDNCCRCLQEDADYRGILIDDILTDPEDIKAFEEEGE